MPRLRNPFKHNARVQTTAFNFFRAEFANIKGDGGRRTPLSNTFLAGKNSKGAAKCSMQSFHVLD
jgi:hypothetical protein